MKEPRDRFSPSFAFGPRKKTEQPPQPKPPEPPRQAAPVPPPAPTAPVPPSQPASAPAGGQAVVSQGAGTFRQWAGGASRATVAIAFTDIVSSSALGMKLGDRAMNVLREAHFQHAAGLVLRHNGYVIKTIGDSVMAAFHAAAEALDFAIAVHADPGDPRIQVRVGIHVGPVTVDDRDAHGSAVNYASRVVAAPKGAEIWISNEAKGHVDMEGVPEYANLPWQTHSGLELKGFPGKHILWSIAMR
jgi:class 3 adenylate cyclase